MSFPLSAYIPALLCALVTTALSVPFWRAWCVRTGHVDDPGNRKIHSAPVPLAGGLAVFTGMAATVLAGVLAVRLGLFEHGASRLLDYGLGRRVVPLLAILGGALGMVLLGWLDDRHELKAGPKFAGQAVIALLVAAAGVRITLFVPSVVFSYTVTVLWLLTVTNAFNFMDNMNGLCAGTGAIAAGWFAVMAARHGQYLVALLALLVCGALAGYLPFNFPKATVFLGDAGSHLVGFLLGVLAILPHFYTAKNPARLAVLTPLLVLAVPLLDLAGVVVMRTAAGKPFWIGDTNHASHRLVRAGLTKVEAVLALWAAGVIFGALSLI